MIFFRFYDAFIIFMQSNTAYLSHFDNYVVGRLIKNSYKYYGFITLFLKLFSPKKFDPSKKKAKV